MFKCFLILVATAYAFRGHALTIEPLVAYQAGKVNDGPVSGKSSLNGATFGGKIGWKLSKTLNAGIDGNYALLEQEFAIAPRVLYPANHQQLGFFLAANFLAFRASTSFLFYNRIYFSSRNEELRGNAIKFGLGVPVVASMRVSADYMIHNFQEATGVNPLLPQDASTIMLSLSYLFSI